jgi:hypothetical protein
MTDNKKGWGSTVLGWFVVRDEDSAADASASPYSGSLVDAADSRHLDTILPPITPSLSARPAAGAPGRPAATPARPAAAARPAAGGTKAPAAAPPAAATPLPVFQKEPPPATGGAVDFAKVFEAATIDASEQEMVAKSVALLGSLPAGTDPTVKKQIVEASLKAFGVPIDKIIETGVEEIQALEGYIRAVGNAAQKSATDAEERIKKLEETIQDLRADMQKRVVEGQSVIKACNDKKLEVQAILEFFGQEAVAKVVQESPKLHDPKDIKS